jgi:hypothetical protein
MRNLIIFMLLVAIFVLGKRSCNVSLPFMGVRGNGPVKTETRSVSGFHGVNLDLSGDVEVRVADTYSVEVQAQENLLPILKTEVKDGVLRIYFDQSVSFSDDIKVRISGPAFDELALGGSGNIKVLTPIKAEKLKLSVGGSGDIDASQADAGSIACSIDGSGGIEVGGKANDLSVDISGSGGFKAKSLTVSNCTVEVSGSGDVNCGEVAQKLKASVSGSGSIQYSGTPSVETHVSGSGSVEKI